MLLRQTDQSIGLSRQLAGCFVDRRDARFVEHGVHELVAQRLNALALGYEDLNDHADPRRDPLLAVAAGKLDPLGLERSEADRGRALAAPATLQWMEAAIDHAGGRYHKLAAQPAAMRELLLRQGLRTLAKATRELIVDFDATDARLHGAQAGRFFHGYYGIIVTCHRWGISARCRCGPNCARPMATRRAGRSRRWPRSYPKSDDAVRAPGSSCAGTAASAARN